MALIKSANKSRLGFWCFVNFVEDSTITKVFRLGFAPAAKVRNGRKLNTWELLGVVLGNLWIAWSIEVFGRNRLSFRCVQIVQVSRCYCGGAFCDCVFSHNSNWRFSKNGNGWVHDFNFISTGFLNRQMRFIFPCE